MITFLLSLALLAVNLASEPPIMAKIVFWLLIILWAIGAIGFHDNPNWVRGSSVVLIVLFAILGWYVFGF